jgi:histone H3/H4
MSDRDVVDDGSESGGSRLSDGEGDDRIANDDDKNAGENTVMMTVTDAAAAGRTAEGMDADADGDDDDDEDNEEENDVEDVGDGGQAHANAEDEDEDEEDGDEPSTSTVADGDPDDDAASDAADADGNQGTPSKPSSRKSSEALTESPAEERVGDGAQEEEGDDDEEEDEAEDDDDNAEDEEDPNDEEGREGTTAAADDEDEEGMAPLSSSSGRGGGGTASANKKSRIPAVSGLTIPFRTVKKAMKLDPDIPIVQNEAAVMVTIAAELFLKSLAKESLVSAAKRSRSTIKYEDVAEARTKRPALSFLEPVLP